ncbi:alpha/beta hydrolase [Mariniblastus fucicola]|uniref:Carboxylesterase NlhH n=1 Tax=Mariniblastus fucicola TaxID=980251 RepID=A0A5B9PE78_9BACT|nr:alpha/beta hydrolase [Mariniblastus fucicola]QEG21331.1 Carboxylesterase NlhH [Mariniblastus fucicola]
MYFRFLIFSVLIFSLLKTVNAQETERVRFKHEKHGAIVFASGEDYELKCDIYQPKSDEPRPVMLAIHGGAWTTGTKFAMYRHARILANRGYVVMAINYRLAPKHKWPAQIHDCKHAVRWIREHAKEYNADPDRVYAFGYSAGAHLASLLATTDKDDGLEGEVQQPYAKHSSRVDGLIAGGAPMEFSWIDAQSTTLTYWLGETKAANPQRYAKASPVTYVTNDDPVAVVFHGTSDTLVPATSPEEFAKCCEKADVECQLILTRDGHASAFTRTSLLIDSLARLEGLLAKQECYERMERMINWIEEFKMAHNRLPKSATELETFLILRDDGPDVSEFADAMTSNRDGHSFIVRWGIAESPIVSESVGIDGEKLSR